MKMRYLSCLGAMLGGLLFFSCQSEIAEEEYDTTETIFKTSPLTTFVQRVAMKNTIIDDAIDGASCFMVKFPYTVTINNTEITISSANDYQLILTAKALSAVDDDIVHFHFPITIVLNDYSEKILTSQSDLDSQIDDCESHKDDFSAINCLSLSFPIVINSYDSYKQIAGSINILDNQSLYNFIDALKSNQYISFSYPLMIKNDNNQLISINSNNQLEDQIEEALGKCSSHSNTSVAIINALISNPWSIKYLYDDNNKTALFNGYVFVFYANKTVIATKAGVSTLGQWEAHDNNGLVEFKMDFSAGQLHDIDSDWKLIEYNSSEIRFKEGGSHEGEQAEYLYFAKTI